MKKAFLIEVSIAFASKKEFFKTLSRFYNISQLGCFDFVNSPVSTFRVRLVTEALLLRATPSCGEATCKKEENLRQGLPKDDAQVQAANHLLPVYRKKLRQLYLQYVRWYHDLKTDPVHKKVIKKIRSFKDDDDMDYAEAVEAVISKRKYLLNRTRN